MSEFLIFNVICNEFVIPLSFSLSLCGSELLGAAKRVNVNIQDADG